MVPPRAAPLELQSAVKLWGLRSIMKLDPARHASWSRGNRMFS